MAINKVVYGGTTLIDLTEDTVTSASLLSGVTAHSADGTVIEGTYVDEKVKSTPAATTKAYIVGTTSSSESTGTLNFDPDVYLDTESGKLHASSFEGDVDGNASSADTLSSARTFQISGKGTAAAVTFDGSGNVNLELSAFNSNGLTQTSGDLLILDGKFF